MLIMPGFRFVSFILLLVFGKANCDSSPSVIIVGAGAAGIAVATKLFENGITNVTILEAEGHIGGRINSVSFGESVVDLGAEWCHGKNNVACKLANDYNLVEFVNFTHSIYASSGKEFDENLAKELLELCGKIYNEAKSVKGISVGQYMINKYNITIQEKFNNDEENQKFAWDVLNTFKGEVLIFKGAFSWHDISAGANYQECEDPRPLNWKGRGFKTALDVLMKKYPDPSKKLPVEEKILLNKRVMEIKWDGNSAEGNKVIVKSFDGAEYVADHVISTVSLGVLKEQHEVLFDPPLPEEKVNAIEELGFGAGMKAFLHFPQKWWAGQDFIAALHWFEKDLANLLKEYPTGPNDNGQSWLADLSRIFTIEENPNVLLVWFTGKFVPQIELLSDDMVVDGVMFVLEKFMGQKFNVSRPDAVLRTKWYTNPHFRGVTSFETVQSFKRKVSGATVLSEPLRDSSGKPMVLFAGEATNPVHYEAEGRIGGRVHSVQFGDAVVDLGAQWCHGQENNTVYELVKDLDLLEPGVFSTHLYSSKGEHVGEEFANQLFQIYNSIYKGDKDCDEITLGEFMMSRYNQSVAEYFEDDEEELQLAYDSIDAITKWALATEGSFTWFQPSAKSDYLECDGNPIQNWKGRGYKTVLDVLMKKYPNPEQKLPVEEKILFNKEVRKITWDGGDNEGATVECSDGSTYTANHVILTTSLGVLKEHHESLFHPPLPQEKINAIKELGISAVGKVFLHFPERWWPSKNFTDFTFLWSEKNLQLSKWAFSEGSTQGGKFWISNLMGLYITDENPNVLAAWFCGECVPLIEGLSDDTLINGIMFALKTFVGKHFQNITKPDSVIRHNWYSDPHFRGTYSYQTVEARKRGTSAEVVLSQPLTSSTGKQTLLFAGEATHPVYYSTVHGAIETGFREANRIINIYK